MAVVLSFAPSSPKVPVVVPPRYLLGTLETDPNRASQEYAAGFRIAEQTVGWNNYEPQDGVFDSGYIMSIKQRIQTFQRAGIKVVISPAIQYPPAWVFSLPDSRYVNQYGATAPLTWAGGFEEPNVVFSQAVRDRVAGFERKVMQELGPSNIWAVRYVNGSLGEVLYPPADNLPGHNNSYWAYDANAQNNASANRPPGLPPNPFPGWRPGQTTYNRQPFSVAQVQQWYEWYVDARMAFVNWHTKLFRGLGFTGFLQLQTPGYGVRPGEYATATAHFLDGTGDPNQTMGRAAIWQKVYAKLTDKRGVTAYVSSMADGSGNPQDQGCQATDAQVNLELDPQVNDWSAVRYVSHLADTYGMTKSGENPGFSDPNRKAVYGRIMLASAAAEMAACSFQSMFWAQDQNLYDGVSGVKLADFKALAATSTPQLTVEPLVIAVIGDYGCLAGSDCTSVSYSAPHEQAVADLVHSWSPDAIVTVGDNSYETGTPAAVQADQQPYKTDVTAGRLYATMGNHDWLTGSDTASTSYFGRPSHYVAHLGGGLVDLFVADTHYQDPDGASASSNQAKQFNSDLASSKAIWKITANHESQYSSGTAGSFPAFRWLSVSGIDLALSGHDHDFEHLVVGGLNYVVAGGSGQSLAQVCTKGCIEGSLWHDSSQFGAVRLTITASTLTCDFITTAGRVEHSFDLSKPPPATPS